MVRRPINGDSGRIGKIACHPLGAPVHRSLKGIGGKRRGNPVLRLCECNEAIQETFQHIRFKLPP